jgi:hypothetical protein
MEDLRRWKAERRGPFADAPDLKRDLTPKIDALNEKLVATLAKARPILRGREALKVCGGRRDHRRNPRQGDPALDRRVRK